MSKFARKNIRKLTPYQPGEQPVSTADVVKLNTNENPYPPSPVVTTALRRLSTNILRTYPEPFADTFRNIAARVLKVRPDMIVTGNGSDELLSLIIRTFVQPGQTIAYPTPTYSLYPVLADLHEANVREVPFGDDFDLPPRLANTRAALFFLANPNAPSGTFIKPATIERFARRVRGLVAVDEAYVDFADDHCLRLVKRNGNIIVLRTVSKGYGLAGLRFGFAVAQADIITDLLKTKDSYNCDAVSIALATAAIKDQAYLTKTVARIRQQRAWLTGRLEKLGFRVLPSQANFVWAIRSAPSAGGIYRRLKQRGILVRYFDQPGLNTGLRITIGRPQENRRLVAALADILG